VIVDRDRPAGVVVLYGVTRDVNLADKTWIESVEPCDWIETQIERRNLDIVDIEQETAAAAPAKGVEEIDLVPITLRIGKIARWIFDQDGAAEPVLDPPTK